MNKVFLLILIVIAEHEAIKTIKLLDCKDFNKNVVNIKVYKDNKRIDQIDIKEERFAAQEFDNSDLYWYESAEKYEFRFQLNKKKYNNIKYYKAVKKETVKLYFNVLPYMVPENQTKISIDTIFTRINDFCFESVDLLVNEVIQHTLFCCTYKVQKERLV